MILYLFLNKNIKTYKGKIYCQTTTKAEINQFNKN